MLLLGCLWCGCCGPVWLLLGLRVNDFAFGGVCLWLAGLRCGWVARFYWLICFIDGLAATRSCWFLGLLLVVCLH